MDEINNAQQPTQNTSSQPATNYKKGSFLHRLAAYLLDSLVLLLISVVINITASSTELTALNFLNYLVAFLYSVLFIGSSGSTPGMKLLKLKVVNTSYQKIGYSTAVGRTLASILSSIALSIGYYWALIDRKRQTWHDKLANTYVVKLDNNNNLIPFTGEEVITTGQKVLFWLAALLLPGIAILGILAAITLIAINPAKQFSQANNTKRMSDVNAIVNAISQYKVDHNDQLPQGITNTPEEISVQGADLCPDLVPTYIAALPVDPKVNNGTPVSNCQTPYDTGYTVSIDAQGRITINAPQAELNSAISVTR